MATWELAGGSLCFRRHKCESGVISNRGISRVFLHEGSCGSEHE